MGHHFELLNARLKGTMLSDEVLREIDPELYHFKLRRTALHDQIKQDLL